MDINELNKKQLILLTLLITFVVSIGTGIVTVSLMKQMPPTVPQTINNVIQRTIEKVTTIEQPKDQDKNTQNTFGAKDQEQLVLIFRKADSNVVEDKNTEIEKSEVGQGVIISDTGLILASSNIVREKERYQVLLGKEMFDVYILKKFDNGFVVLKIGEETETEDAPVEDLENKDVI